jgi:hypothetical protein
MAGMISANPHEDTVKHAPWLSPSWTGDHSWERRAHAESHSAPKRKGWDSNSYLPELEPTPLTGSPRLGQLSFSQLVIWGRSRLGSWLLVLAKPSSLATAEMVQVPQLPLGGGGGNLRVGLGPSALEDCPWPQCPVAVYSRAAVSTRRSEPLLAPQHAHLRVASRQPGHHHRPTFCRVDPGTGFSGQPTPGQGE